MLIPFLLTLIATTLGLLLIMLLFWTAWRHRNPETAPVAPPATRPSGPAATNRWIRGLRVGFLALFVVVFGFHSYWVFKADSTDGFIRSKRLDARNRRLAESGLKGWILDRSGKLENSLIRYRNDAGTISREYPLGEAAVHLTGYSDFVFGAGGFEYAFRQWLTEPVSSFNRATSSGLVGRDLKVSVDSKLQRETFDLLAASGKPAAAIVLLLPNNEVLAMASSPSFDPRTVVEESTWRRMNQQAETSQDISPLVNRALGTLVSGGPAFYYRPGSTFKTFTAAAAIDAGVSGEVFTCRAEGFTPPGSGRPIRDYGGEVHGSIGLADAFKHSCNQYFAQLGLKLGRLRLADYAKRLHFALSPDDQEPSGAGFWQTEHGDLQSFSGIFAPPRQKMNLSASATPYDIALQSIGQGFDDVAVIQMALIASAVASSDGVYVAPTFEPGGKRKVISQFISPQSAARVRELMRLVVQSGTASGAFASLDRGLTAGGKTGTADREVTSYDREGNPVEVTDSSGIRHTKHIGVTDSWFIGYAPANNPRIAYAVMVENGGQGAHSAAPIAVKLIEKAAALGYVSGSDVAAGRH